MPPVENTQDDDQFTDESIDGMEDLEQAAKAADNKEDRDLDEDLLSEEERAALDDDLSQEDVYDPENPDGEGAAENEGAAPAPAEEPAQENAAPAPAGLSDQSKELARLQAEAEAISQKWQDGDLSDEDYNAQLRANAKAEAKAESAQEQYQAGIEEDTRNWKGAVGDYKTQNPEIWADPKVLSAFNLIVQDVTGNPLYANLPFDQQLARAHSQLAMDAEALKLPAVSAPGAKKTPAPATTKGKEADKPQRPKPPQTLAKLPASDLTGAGDGAFAQIDRLAEIGAKPELSEAALARMSSEDRERYGMGM